MRRRERKKKMNDIKWRGREYGREEGLERGRGRRSKERTRTETIKTTRMNGQREKTKRLSWRVN